MPRLPPAGLPAITLVVLVAISGACAARGDPAPDSGRRLVLVTLDGVRWQEVFRGADARMLASAADRASPATLAALLRPSADGARRALMPFVWDTIAARGQLFGNRDRGSVLRVANAARVSYPGYHELLTGFVNPGIVDNRRQPNPDVTVLEWLHRRPGFAGSVVAFGAWDAFPFILNRERSKIPVSQGENAGLPAVVDRLRGEVPPPWKDSVYDAFVFRAGLEVLATRRPRVLYLALGDPDEWAHAGRYERYLESLQRSDRWLRELWQALEANPAYRGRTNLIVTTDHGRGEAADSWSRHDPETAGSDQAWAALLGPGVRAAGERRDHPPLTLSQIAATAGALLGQDYAGATPAAARPLPIK